MADTGEDREIKERVEAHEAEVIRESKQLVAKIKEASQKSASEIGADESHATRDRANRIVKKIDK